MLATLGAVGFRVEGQGLTLMQATLVSGVGVLCSVVRLHVLTRCVLSMGSYSVEADFKPLGITPEVVTNSAKRTEARKQIKKMFQERYAAGKNKWFFSKLRF
jgi:hypothetical protein